MSHTSSAVSEGTSLPRVLVLELDAVAAAWEQHALCHAKNDQLKVQNALCEL